MAARSHWVKIDRALDHIDALDDAIKAWRDDDPYSVRAEDGPYVDGRVLFQGTWTLGLRRTALVFRLRDESYPVEWSAYIGDAVHNLRAALDHIAYALNAKGYADANNGAELPPGDTQASEFPIVGHVNKELSAGQVFNNAAKSKLRFAHPDAVKAIKAIQPYHAGQKRADDLLWVLYDLDRIDKHRKLVVASALTESLDIGHITFDGVFGYGIAAPGQPLRHGSELAWWLEPASEESKVSYDLDLTFGEAFGEGTPCAGWPLVKTLRDLRDYLRVKVPPLDQFC